MIEKILVVDDDIAILDMLSDVLSQRGYEVILVDSGFKAIDLINRKHFDVVLLDINMPGINGIDTFKMIKRISPFTTVIMITAYDTPELINQALKENAFGIVYKPLKMSLLFNLIKKGFERVKVFFVSSDRQKINSFLDETSKLNIEEYNIFTSENILEIIELSKSIKLDIGIIHTPSIDLDTFVTIDKFREISPGTSLVLITDFTEEEYIDIALKKGIYLVLKKPLNMKELFEKIEKIIEEKKKEFSKSILLIEDDKYIVESLSVILTKEGYEVVSAITAQDALDKVRSKYFSIALVDYKLPDMSGLELVKKLKQTNKSLSVIFLTGYPDLNLAIEALREEVSDFLTKPVDPQQLLSSIDKVIRKSLHK